MTGLIAGSIIPDFEYFIRIENRSRFSHSMPGILWFDLPMAVLICFLFHNVVKSPLILNSPYKLHVRLIKYNGFKWNAYFSSNWFKVVYSILIGILTHIVSDRVTHRSSNIVSSVPGLLETQELIDSPKSIYRVIQITFSIIGLALSAFCIWQFPLNKPDNNFNPNYGYWLLMCVFFITALALIIIRIGYDRADLIVSSISAFLAALLLASLIPLATPVRKRIWAGNKLNSVNNQVTP